MHGLHDSCLAAIFVVAFRVSVEVSTQDKDYASDIVCLQSSDHRTRPPCTTTSIDYYQAVQPSLIVGLQ